MSKLDCSVVIVVGSKKHKTMIKGMAEASKRSPITVGGDSYDMMDFKDVGLCFCAISSNTQANARIAKLRKIGKYFNYEKVIVVDPPYTETAAKNARVGVMESWYFVKEKQALLDLLKVDYERLGANTKKALDKLEAPPPQPQPDLEIFPGQFLFRNDHSYALMREPNPYIVPPELQLLHQLLPNMHPAAFIGGIGERVWGQGAFRRRAPDPPAREAQPEVKKAKAISQDEMECLCCAENQKDTILNCGHLELCGICASKVEACPSCSVPITERKHVWL